MRETEGVNSGSLPPQPSLSFLVCDQEAHCPMESRGIHLPLCGRQIHVSKETCFHPCEFRLRNGAMLGRVLDWELQTLPRDFVFLAVKPSSLSGLLDYPASWTHTSASVLHHLFTALKIAWGKQQFTLGEPQNVVFNYCLGDPWAGMMWFWVGFKCQWWGAMANVYLYGFLITGMAFCFYLSLKFWSHEFPNYIFFYV